MKRLLLVAFLLVTAGLAYGKVQVEVPAGSRTAKGNLVLESRGEVIDPTGKFYLEITPTMSAGADGTSLIFNHGTIPKGNVGEDKVGGFEARIVKYGENGIIEKIVPGKYTAKLKTGDSEAQINGEENNLIKKVNIISSDKGSSSMKLLGMLNYNLQVSSPSDEKVQVFEGSIISNVDAKEAEGTGSFIDREVEVEITVKGIDTIITGEA